MPGMWRALIDGMTQCATFAEPVDDDDIRSAEAILNQPIPAHLAPNVEMYLRWWIAGKIRM